MYQQQGIRMRSLCGLCFRRSDARMGGTSAVQQLDLLFRNLLSDPVAEVAVRNKQDLVIGQCADDFYGRGGCDGDIADGFSSAVVLI